MIDHFSSVAQSCPTLQQPHGLQHIRRPCPTPTPGACSNSCPLSWWCHPTISSSVVPFSSYLQSFPASGVSSWHQVAKVLEFQLQHQSSNEYLGLISFRIYWFDLLAVQKTLKSLQHHNSKASSSPAFHKMYSAYTLNKQDDNIWPDVILSQFGTSLLFHMGDQNLFRKELLVYGYTEKVHIIWTIIM